MSEHIKEYQVEPAIELEAVKVVTVKAVELDEEKKKKTTQRCAISNKSCRYLFTIEREDGESIDVSAEILRKNLGATQKQVDKLYCLAYYSEHPQASTAVSEEAKEEAINSFLNN